MSDENESIHFNLKFLKRRNFLCGLDVLIVKVIQASNCSQYNQNARSDLLVDLQSVFAGEEHGLHTNDFTAAAQNLNQPSKKPTSPSVTC